MPWRSGLTTWTGSWRGGGSAPPVTPPALVQKRAQSLSGAASTYVATFTANLSALTNAIVCVFAGQNVDAPTAFSGFGATWAFHTIGISGPNFKSVTIAIGYNPTSLSGSVTITKPAIGNNECSVLYEVSGLKAQDATQPATGSAGSTGTGVLPATAAYSALAANDLVVAGIVMDYYSNPPANILPPTGTPAGQVLSLDVAAYSNGGNVSIWAGLFLSDATHQTQLTAPYVTVAPSNIARATAEYAHA